MNTATRTSKKCIKQLEAELQTATNKKHRIVIGGEWNAEVKSIGDGRRVGALGCWANPVDNVRGERLSKWVWEQKLVVASFSQAFGQIFDSRAKV